ncbi:MAG: hypothetical protein ACI9W6_001490 [Motiliproteus sp.]|jgi:hypothetical protein
MHKTLDQKYMQVARACLQVLNNVNPAADRTAQIQELYGAIDTAINQLYKQQEQSLGRSFSALRAIAELDPEQDQVAAAIKLAREALPPSH